MLKSIIGDNTIYDQTNESSKNSTMKKLVNLFKFCYKFIFTFISTAIMGFAPYKSKIEDKDKENS